MQGTVTELCIVVGQKWLQSMPVPRKPLPFLQSTVKHLNKIKYARVSERIQIVSPDLCGKQNLVQQITSMD